MKNKKGFTLVELLAIIALIGIVMLLVTPNIINLFNNSKKNAFYDEVISVYNNTYTTYSSRILEGDTSKRFCLGKDTTTNKLEIKDKKNFYYDVTLNENGKIVSINVKNNNYSISITNGNGIDKSDIKESNIKENEDDNFYCSTVLAGAPIKDAMLRDNTISERTDFTNTNIENTTGIIYKTNKTEDGSEVYYYSGNTTNNWVKFGKLEKDIITYRGYFSEDSEAFQEYNSLEECNNAISHNVNCTQHKLASAGDDLYWRIIRTNEDGSVRLLYSGTSLDTTEGYIGGSYYNSNLRDPLYTGYMYGESGTLSSNRQNTNDSIIKIKIDKWYEDNLLNKYDKYISKDAIYCGDRSIGEGTYNLYSSEFYYGPYVRLHKNKTPSYKCGANTSDGLFESVQSVADKFSVSTGAGGNGQLKYPIALMTADEVAFAGGRVGSLLSKPYAWYYANSKGNSTVGYLIWWIMSPTYWSSQRFDLYVVTGSMQPGGLLYASTNSSYAVRPVISLRTCTVVTGTGTSTDPYVVSDSKSTC